jgi:hypothetical protein
VRQGLPAFDLQACRRRQSDPMLPPLPFFWCNRICTRYKSCTSRLSAISLPSSQLRPDKKAASYRLRGCINTSLCSPLACLLFSEPPIVLRPTLSPSSIAIQPKLTISAPSQTAALPTNRASTYAKTSRLLHSPRRPVTTLALTCSVHYAATGRPLA